MGQTILLSDVSVEEREAEIVEILADSVIAKCKTSCMKDHLMKPNFLDKVLELFMFGNLLGISYNRKFWVSHSIKHDRETSLHVIYHELSHISIDEWGMQFEKEEEENICDAVAENVKKSIGEPMNRLVYSEVLDFMQYH